MWSRAGFSLAAATKSLQSLRERQKLGPRHLYQSWTWSWKESQKGCGVPAAPIADLLQIPLASGTVRPHQPPKHLFREIWTSAFQKSRASDCCEAVSSLGQLWSRKLVRKCGEAVFTLQLANRRKQPPPSEKAGSSWECEHPRYLCELKNCSHCARSVN